MEKLPDHQQVLNWQWPTAVHPGKALGAMQHVLEKLPQPGFDEYLIAELHLYWSLSLLINDDRGVAGMGQDELDMEAWATRFNHLLKEEAAMRPSSLRIELWYARLMLGRIRMHHSKDRDTGEASGIRDHCVDNASSILSEFIQTDPRICLGYSDHSVFIIAYAALTMFDLEADETLAQSASQRLMAVPTNDEHIASRHACVIQNMRWRGRQMTHQTGTFADLVDEQVPNLVPPFSRLADLEY